MTFQIFFLVILFAAYNGLVVLPVLLSIAGPSHQSTFASIAKAVRRRKRERRSEEKDGDNGQDAAAAEKESKVAIYSGIRFGQKEISRFKNLKRHCS